MAKQIAHEIKKRNPLRTPFPRMLVCTALGLAILFFPKGGLSEKRAPAQVSSLGEAREAARKEVLVPDPQQKKLRQLARDCNIGKTTTISVIPLLFARQLSCHVPPAFSKVFPTGFSIHWKKLRKSYGLTCLIQGTWRRQKVEGCATAPLVSCFCSQFDAEVCR